MSPTSSKSPIVYRRACQRQKGACQHNGKAEPLCVTCAVLAFRSMHMDEDRKTLP